DHTDYVAAYKQQKKPQKGIEFADKLVALGDKAEPGIRYQALFARSMAFASLPLKESDPGAKEIATKAREAALLGLKTLDELKKPDNISEADWPNKKKQHAILFNYKVGNAEMITKDYQAAVQYF